MAKNNGKNKKTAPKMVAEEELPVKNEEKYLRVQADTASTKVNLKLENLDSRKCTDIFPFYERIRKLQTKS